MNGIYISRCYNIKVIPCDVDQYCHVAQIRICDNPISILPVELFNLDLITLTLSDNAIKVLPREIKNLTNLKCLRIHYNKLTTLPKELFSLNKIDDFSINSNKFKNTWGPIKHRLKILLDNGSID